MAETPARGCDATGAPLSDATLRALVLAHYWRCFTPTVTAEAAAARFVALYGRPPEYLFDLDGLLWVGPAPAPGGPARGSSGDVC